MGTELSLYSSVKLFIVGHHIGMGNCRLRYG